MSISNWCKRPTAGDLSERVTIEAPTSTRTASGAPVLSWGVVATVYADVHGVSGREIVQSMQVDGLVTHRVKIRFREDVDSQCRILWRGKVLEVVAAVPRFQRAFLEITAREVEDGK